jgi:hypothetical protein
VRLVKWVYKPLICVVGATCAARAILSLMPYHSAMVGWSATWHCLFTLGLYLLLLVLTGCLDRDDRAWVASLFSRRAHDGKSKE